MSASNVKEKGKEKLKHMPKKMLESFVKLLNVQSSSNNEKIMLCYIMGEINNLKDKNITMFIDAVGNLIVEKNPFDLPIIPCVAAHMDTVYSIRKDYSVVLLKDKYDKHDIAKAMSKNKPTGVGGDDKCGIFFALHALEHIDNIKVVFFTQEESGLVGSSDIEHNDLSNVGHIMQLDRWGRGDMIDSTWEGSTVSNRYKQLIEPAMLEYGYTHEVGLITDSINLFEKGIGVSCVNISCGYYKHHTSDEYIDINEFYNSILYSMELLKVLGNELFTCSPNPYNNSYYDKGYYDDSYYDKKLTGYECDSFDYYDNIDLAIADDILSLMGIHKPFTLELFFSLNETEKEWIREEYLTLTGDSLLV